MRRETFSLYDLPFFDRASAVVVMVAYFDASEAGEFLGVGGYMFRKKNIRPFERQWRAMLRKHDLEYFHMTDCNATPPQGPFAGKDKTDCVDALHLAVAAICGFATEGFSAAVKPAEFYDVMGHGGLVTNPFTMCVFSVLAQCAKWAEENDPTARIIYVFESGDDHQADANKIIQSIADNPKRRRRYCYEKHAFLPKRESWPTQAADILAWNMCKQWGREQRGINRLRGDFSELVDKVRTRKDFLTKQRLQELVDFVVKEAPDWIPHPDKVAGLNLRLTNENQRATLRELAALMRGAE